MIVAAHGSRPVSYTHLDVYKRQAIPHIPVAQCTDQMKWDKITWKKYLADEKLSLIHI